VKFFHSARFTLCFCTLGLFSITALLKASCLEPGPGPHESPELAASRAIDRAVKWLGSQQGADGGWHSETYGAMRCGAGNTALILNALSRLPRTRAGYLDVEQRAIDFLIRNLDGSGCVRGTGGVVDHPVYASALTLSALNRIDSTRYREPIARIAAFLRRAQSLPECSDSDRRPGFGGWGPTSGIDSSTSAISRTNLSVTCCALEALAETGRLNEDGRQAAISFVLSCRASTAGLKISGSSSTGFCFSPHPGDLMNKEGFSSSGAALPYGPPTCDGIRSLRSCGLPNGDQRITTPVMWLETAFRSERAGANNEATDWSDSLWYYHAATFSKVARQVDSAVLRKRRSEVLAVIVACQAPDGFWQNADGRMSEDDPLVATALVLCALSAEE